MRCLSDEEAKLLRSGLSVPTFDDDLATTDEEDMWEHFVSNKLADEIEVDEDYICWRTTSLGNLALRIYDVMKSYNNMIGCQ